MTLTKTRDKMTESKRYTFSYFNVGEAYEK